jgi:hypothetical protein
MDAEELMKLRDDINELEKLIGIGSGISLVITADTGEAALCQNGSYFKIKSVVRRRMAEEPTLAPSCERALHLIDEVNEGMAQYIREFGKLPPELYTH